MRIKSNYKLREIAGETIVVKQGKSSLDMTNIISLNNSAKVLYQQLLDKDFTLVDVTKVLTDTYQISEKRAANDAAIWVESMRKCDILE